MYRATADHFDQVVAVVAHFEHLASNIHAHFLNHTQNVALRGVGIGTNDEVGAAEGIEMRCVVGGEEDAVKHLPQFLRRRRWIYMPELIQRLR